MDSGLGFKPGLRISLVDAFVIFVGILSSCYLWSSTEWLGFIVAFVAGHFFLSCNVFRIARTLELIWASIFLVLALCTAIHGLPGWPITVAVSLVMMAVAVGTEMRKPSYHGVGWRRINPGLRQWWDASMARRSS